MVNAIKSGKYEFIRCNFPNGDMVGHTGSYEATIKAVEAVDENVGKIMKACIEDGYMLIVLADHGNAEEMYQLKNPEKKQAKTSHTTNLVPFILYGENANNYEINSGNFGLANLASTITTLLDVEPNSTWLPSIIKKIK